MTSYNKVNGVHMSQNKEILEGIVRNEWGWKDGLIMSDWFGTFTSKEALEAGLDLEMPGPAVFRRNDEIAHMIKTKELNIKVLNERVRNVLTLIKKLSESSGVPENAPEDTDNNTPETRKLLRKLAQDSIVLLKMKIIYYLCKKMIQLLLLDQMLKLQFIAVVVQPHYVLIIQLIHLIQYVKNYLQLQNIPLVVIIINFTRIG